MHADALPPPHDNRNEWGLPVVLALLVHLLVAAIFIIAWVWSPSRSTEAAAGDPALEANMQLSAAAASAVGSSDVGSAVAPITRVRAGDAGAVLLGDTPDEQAAVTRASAATSATAPRRSTPRAWVVDVLTRPSRIACLEPATAYCTGLRPRFGTRDRLSYS